MKSIDPVGRWVKPEGSYTPDGYWPNGGRNFKPIDGPVKPY